MATFDGTKPSYQGGLISADIRDNFNALKDNEIVAAYSAKIIDNGAISQAKLKTSSGSVSTSSKSGAYITLPGGEYGFWPQLKNEQSGDVARWGYNFADAKLVAIASTSSTSYVSPLYLVTNSDTYSAYTRQRYVTASGEVYWIFIMRDKSSRKIISAYQAPDHPCFGNGGDPDKVQHPFGDFDPAKHEILVINPDIAFMKQIYDKTPKGNDLLETLFADYEIDEFVSPAWPDKEVTTDVVDNDFPFAAKNDKAKVVKQKVKKPDMMKTAGLKKKVK